MTCRALFISPVIVLGVAGLAGLVGCGGDATPALNGPSTVPLAVTIVPHPITALIGTVVQFTATVSGPVGSSQSGISQSVVWSVAGSGCSGASCGTIDASGTYTAPATIPDPATVTVTARSAADSRWLGAVTMAIVDSPGETFSFSINPDGIAFGNQTVNTGASKNFTLTNTGNASQPVSARMNGANFADFTETNDCPSTLAAGDSCTFTITFRPSATGFRGGILVLDGTFEEEADVNLTGTGTS